MTVSPEVLEARLENFIRESRGKGLRVTHQRIEIFRTVASMETHPDAEAVYRLVRERLPTIALDTVYRNLNFLAGHGLLTIVGLSHERLRFDGNLERHDHFVCTRCGMIRDFQSEELASVSAPKEAARFGEAVSMHLEVKGVCTGCRE